MEDISINLEISPLPAIFPDTAKLPDYCHVIDLFYREIEKKDPSHFWRNIIHVLFLSCLESNLGGFHSPKRVILKDATWSIYGLNVTMKKGVDS